MTTIDPQKEEQRLREVYAGMVDGELEQLSEAAGELTDIARTALKAEMARRGLAFNDVEDSRAPEPQYVSRVTVGKFRDLSEALLAKGMLESAGIECFLADQDLVRMDWFYSNAIGGMRLQVREEDADAATELLEQPIPDNFEVNADGQSYEQPRCPDCQSLDIQFEGVNQGLGLATGFVIGLPLPLRSDTWKCNACGNKWKDEV
jgi:Putative prokaryotic signal transducing protein